MCTNLFRNPVWHLKQQSMLAANIQYINIETWLFLYQYHYDHLIIKNYAWSLWGLNKKFAQKGILWSLAEIWSHKTVAEPLKTMKLRANNYLSFLCDWLLGKCHTRGLLLILFVKVISFFFLWVNEFKQLWKNIMNMHTPSIQSPSWNMLFMKKMATGA